MAKALVIAYGNPLRCDDGLAWRAAQELSKLNLPDVEINTAHQLTPEFAHSVSQASFVVFLDAGHAGTPGEIFVQTVIPVSQSVIFTHDFLPETILNAAEYLYKKAPDAVLISLVGENFSHGETLSEKIAASIPTLVGRVKDVLRQGGATLPAQP